MWDAVLEPEATASPKGRLKFHSHWFLLQSGSITWVNDTTIAVRFTPLEEMSG